MDLKDKVAVITGGASGLGYATAREFIHRGAKVVIFDINEDKGAVAQETLGEHAFFVKVDVTDEDSVQQGIETALNTFGAIHVCINCAGSGDAARTVGREGPYPLDRFKFILDLNLTGTFNVLRLCAYQMQNNEPLSEDGERGVIINTGSVAGIDGQIGQAAYSASKGGVIGMTLPVARDLGKLGIRVNTICPGVFKTDLLGMLPQDMQDKLAANAQFPQRLGKPEEFGLMAVQVCENPYLNGEVIRLDAAMRMPPK